MLVLLSPHKDIEFGNTGSVRLLSKSAHKIYIQKRRKERKVMVDEQFGIWGFNYAKGTWEKLKFNVDY